MLALIRRPVVIGSICIIVAGIIEGHFIAEHDLRGSLVAVVATPTPPAPPTPLSICSFYTFVYIAELQKCLVT